MNGNGFKNCTNDIIAVTKYIDGQLAGANTSATIKNQYLGAGAANNSNVGFAAALGYIYQSYQNELMEGSGGRV